MGHNSSLAALVATLHALRGDRSWEARARRAGALAALRSARPRRASQVVSIHDDLLFLVAFPPSLREARRAARLLDTFERWVTPLGPGARAELADSGIAGTTTAANFPWSFVRWLQRHEERAEPVVADDKAAERIAPILRSRVTPAEEDAFDAGTWTWRQFLRLRGGTRPLDWLVATSSERVPHLARIFDEAEVPVRWSLDGSPWSTSRTRVPVPRPTVRAAFRRVPTDATAFLREPLRAVRRLRPDECQPWVDASIAALGARAREVTPTMDPNPDEVYLADLGEGAALCLLGTHPTRRCALEANYGYVMFSNGVPIGYGGVTPLANQANTGANLFPAFRGSEAPFLFAQSLRAFRHLFGVRRFIVNPYQFGADNDEALASGAFWFYDRLGFRSVRAPLRALARAERDRLRRDPSHRSTLRTLRRLAKADLVLDLGGGPVPLFRESHLVTLGRRVAESLPGVGDDALRDLALRYDRRAARQGTRWWEGWRRLGPLVALIHPDLAGWTPAARRALDAIIEAKGAPRERRYAQLAREHVPFWRALTSAARGNRR